MENILSEMRTEEISTEIQKYKGGKVTASREADRDLSNASASLTPSVTDDDSQSLASQSESGIHIHRIDAISASTGDLHGQMSASEIRQTKLKLWSELKISGGSSRSVSPYLLS